MTNDQRTLSGIPAMLVAGGAGGWVLSLGWQMLADGATPGAGPAFVLGIACGYVGPFVLRLADLRSRPDPGDLRWRWGARIAVFFPPIAAVAVVITALIAGDGSMSPPAHGFSVGVVAQWLLGMALVIRGNARR